MSSKNKVLLILPCTKKKPYTAAPTWKFILKHLEPWKKFVELAAVDCITNPKTGKPFGIVLAKEQHLTIDKDERPDPNKLPILISEIRKKLKKLSKNYRFIVAYVNVKAYWKALEAVKDEFNICMLPSVYRNPENWNHIGIGPIGMFKKAVGELTNTIEELVNERR